jgi:hypothetical protein
MQPDNLNPETLFQIANLAALVGWATLLISPFVPRAADRIAGFGIPALLAAAYVGLLLAFWGRAEGGFGSLEEVGRLFQDSQLLLAGWLHYLAFDLFVGAWIVRAARRALMPFWLTLPCLPLAFLFGPAGLLLFLALRAARGRTVSASA